MRIMTGGKRVSGNGDGVNDVGMILVADCGIGIEGKEGMHRDPAGVKHPEIAGVELYDVWHGQKLLVN